MITISQEYLDRLLSSSFPFIRLLIFFQELFRFINKRCRIWHDRDVVVLGQVDASIESCKW